MRRFNLVLSFIVGIALMIYVQEILVFKILFYLVGISLWIHIINQDREYQTKIMWLMLIMFSPILGIVMYSTIGFDYKSLQIYKDKTESDKEFAKYEKYSNSYQNDDYYERVLSNIGKANISRYNEIEVLNNGVEKFPKLLEKIKGAKRYIHLQYYIIHKCSIQEEIFEQLKKKAREGVEVRVILDTYGSHDITNEMFKDWENAGIKVAKFGFTAFKYIPAKNLLNYRNHRKIVTIDGMYGFIGGINIGDEYLFTTKKFGCWRDTTIMIKGEANRDLELVFARDWYYLKKKNYISDKPEYYLNAENCTLNNCVVQILRTGPDVKNVSIKDVYIKLISEAKKEVTIMTPYLVPEFDITKTLKLAAENNVRVRMITPGNPDNFFVHSLTRSYYQTLMESGVEVYEMQGSFVHAKVIIIDDELSVCGTTNFDFRSFNLNFEATAFMVSKEVNQKFKKQCAIDLQGQTPISLEKWNKRNFVKKTYGNVIQIFSSLA